MNKISLIALIVLFIVSAVHLYGTYNRKPQIRILTKWLLIPLMMAAYYFAVPIPDLYVMAAFFFCWAGDILLLCKGPQFFILGGVAFFMGHICFICAYFFNIDFGTVPYVTIIPILLLFISIIFMVSSNMKEYVPKMLKIPMVSYLLANAVMNAFAIMQMFSKPGNATITISLGAILFFFSDLILFDVRFHKGSTTYKRHFLEMLAYIMGELLICYGFIQMHS